MTPPPAPMRLRNKRHKGIVYESIFQKDSKCKISTKYTTILASGPNGEKAWRWLIDNIPREQNTIMAVNFAATYFLEFDLPYLKPDLWVVTDKRAVHQVVPPDKKPWFPPLLRRADIQPCFNLRVIEECWRTLKHKGPYFTFPCKRLMLGEDIKPHSDVIRPGGSVSCSGLQIWDKIVVRPDPICLICGADMSGDKYARGSNVLKKHGEVWRSCHVLGKMIQYLQQLHKRKIYTISESKLVDFGYVQFYPSFPPIAKESKATEGVTA